MNSFIVYIIRSAWGRYYIGQTNNLSDRIDRHNQNRNKYTKNKGPWELVISFEVNTRSEAVQLESYLKKLKDPHKAIEYMTRLNNINCPDRA